MDPVRTRELVAEEFKSSVIGTLCDYIRIPNSSPAYDTTKTNSAETEKVITLFQDWVTKQNVPELEMSVHRLENRTPLLFLSMPSSGDYEDSDAILMYGHLDKQPPFEGWESDLGPYKPVIKENKHGEVLYGRGGADDGYSLFSCVLALKALHDQQISHARVVVLIEASEESGSPDLPMYLELLSADIGKVSLVICLDSGSGDYSGLWLTNSLRGLLVANLKVTTVGEGVHSGIAGGIVSDSFRVIRKIISVIENESTGEVCSDFQVHIPSGRLQEVEQLCDILGDEVWRQFHLPNGIPMRGGLNPPKDNNFQMVLDNTWRANLTVTGQDGLPSCAAGGNVLRPSTCVKLSLRLPPTFDHTKAFEILQTKVEQGCPPDAVCELSVCQAAGGYEAPILADWLKRALHETSMEFFGRTFACLGSGGTIPFMGMLGRMFPSAQFVITGLLGPESNAHGPNEFLHLKYCQQLTCAVAHIIEAHGKTGHKEQTSLHANVLHTYPQGACC